jgi:pyruvate dehydrogenase E2 component (dihydrolipoamide acetyltransferase)
MPYDVKLPDIGEGIAEGEIVRWLVKAGETVREDQPLVEVMTDKATVEIPSPRAGVIATIAAAEGQVVPVGSVIVSIAVAGETAGASVAARVAAAPAPANADAARWNNEGGAIPGVATSAPSPPAGRAQATPAVRQLAKQLGVALESLAGSGPGGAITADDVKRAAGGASAAGRACDVGRACRRRSSRRRRAHSAARLRRRIAEHMRRSLDPPLTSPSSPSATGRPWRSTATGSRRRPRRRASGSPISPTC